MFLMTWPLLLGLGLGHFHCSRCIPSACSSLERDQSVQTRWKKSLHFPVKARDCSLVTQRTNFCSDILIVQEIEKSDLINFSLLLRIKQQCLFFWFNMQIFLLFREILDRAYLIGNRAKTCLLFVLSKIYIYLIQKLNQQNQYSFCCLQT